MQSKHCLAQPISLPQADKGLAGTADQPPGLAGTVQAL